MIEYPRGCFNLPLLVHGFHGSCFLRALPKPLLSTAFAIYLWYYPSHLKVGAGRPGTEPDDTQVWRNPSFRNTYPFAVSPINQPQRCTLLLLRVEKGSSLAPELSLHDKPCCSPLSPVSCGGRTQNAR